MDVRCCIRHARDASKCYVGEIRMDYLNFDLRWQRRYSKEVLDVPSQNGSWLYAGIGTSRKFDRRQCAMPGFHSARYPFMSYSLLCSFFVQMDRREKTLLFDRMLKTPGAVFQLYRAKSDLSVAIPIDSIERRVSWFFDWFSADDMANWRCYLDDPNHQCPYYMENVIYDKNR